MFSSPLPTTTTLLAVLLTSLILCDVTLCAYDVKLEEMTSVKIPVYDDEGEAVFEFGSDSVRKLSLDASRKLLYVTGANAIHFLNASDPSRLVILGHTSLPDVTLYDVKACGEHVMATYTQEGKSGFLLALGYNPFNKFRIILLETFYEATEPVSLAMTSDCRTAVIAVNGRAYYLDEERRFVDPKGAVVIINVAAILARETTFLEAVTVLNFGDLNADRVEELVKQGVRFPMKGIVGHLSHDLDPTSVTIDDVTMTAYVTLQSNNAIAEVDILTKNVTRITALGLKDWRELDIDVSDKDGVRFQRPPIYSFYQPGAIAVTYHSGGTFLLTANTGAKRDYSHFIGWSEAMTGSDLINNNMVASSVEPQLRQALKDESQLGSLLFTTINGEENNFTVTNEVTLTPLTKFVAFGGRSFSLRRLPDLELVYDSGSDVEMHMADRANTFFNCPVLKGSNVVRYDRDLASTDKGPEPLSVASGKLGSLSVLAVGLANPGGVLLYSVPLRSDDPGFETLWFGLPDSLKTWDQLYDGSGLGGVRVTDLEYVPSHVTGSDPWLLVAGSKSGTVTVLKVKASGVVPTYMNNSCQGIKLDSAWVRILLFAFICTWTQR